MRIPCTLFLLLPALAGAVGASPTALVERVRAHPLAESVLTNRYILLEAEGDVAIDFRLARRAFDRDDLLAAVQQEYSRQLPEGETPEFSIEQTRPGHYAYVNRKGRTSEITELLRTRAPGGINLVLHARGERFFGWFQSLVVVHTHPVDKTRSGYRVRVYAYPERGVSRFLARHLPMVDWYFRRKTRSITKLATDICIALCEQELSRTALPAASEDAGPS